MVQEVPEYTQMGLGELSLPSQKTESTLLVQRMASQTGQLLSPRDKM